MSVYFTVMRTAWTCALKYTREFVHPYNNFIIISMGIAILLCFEDALLRAIYIYNVGSWPSVSERERTSYAHSCWSKRLMVTSEFVPLSKANIIMIITMICSSHMYSLSVYLIHFKHDHMWICRMRRRKNVWFGTNIGCGLLFGPKFRPYIYWQSLWGRHQLKAVLYTVGSIRCTIHDIIYIIYI